MPIEARRADLRWAFWLALAGIMLAPGVASRSAGRAEALTPGAICGSPAPRPAAKS